MHVLTFNSGSSSLKFGFYRVDDGNAEMLLDGAVEANGATSATDSLPFARVAELLDRAHLPEPDAVGHRIVHGGMRLRHHCRIDDAVLLELAEAVHFAPLHLPAALAVLRFARSRYPDVPQVACLDTAFHAHLDEVARRLPLPKSFDAQGIHRYGFHGLSCASIVRRLGAELPERLVIAHLGNGASVTAVRRGRSIDTTMGLTPNGGVPMGTRSGDLDPGIVVYLMRRHGLDADALEDLFARRSGLLGISGFASDMLTLRDVAGIDSDCRLAISMFCYSVRKQIAAMAAALGGIDALVFSGGIGENDAATRSEICAELAWMGVTLDASRDFGDLDFIHHASSKVSVSVMSSQEDEQIALEAIATLAMS